jgi:prepilin-type N-terminal cleavage/methylation domain-containing protein
LKRNNGGFTLIEVLISIVVLGLVVLPVCSSLVMATRINAKAESILDAKLAVSSAVETMMASGIDSTKNYDSYDTENMEYTVTRATDSGTELPYYNVTVTYKDSESGKELVSVTTQIRAGGGAG